MCEVSLIADVFVGRQKDFKSRCFGGVEQIAILELACPTLRALRY